MQDENGKVEEQLVVDEPEVEVIPSPSEPRPEQVIVPPVIEPILEPSPEPVASQPIIEPVPGPEAPTPPPEPEIVPIPEPIPPVAVEAPPVVSVPLEPPTPEPIITEPVKHAEPIPEPLPAETSKPDSGPEQGDIPQKVLELTPDELDAARRLWATQNIKSVQAKSAHDRTARRKELLTQIEKYIKANTPATLAMVAYHANISPRKASDYLRILVKSGRIKATGHTSSRTYF